MSQRDRPPKRVRAGIRAARRIPTLGFARAGEVTITRPDGTIDHRPAIPSATQLDRHLDAHFTGGRRAKKLDGAMSERSARQTTRCTQCGQTIPAYTRYIWDGVARQGFHRTCVT